MMKQVGLNSVRTSIQWSRLIKDFETGETDPDAVRYYNEVIDEFLAQGIHPIMNLVHFDLPVELLHQYGGWESKKVVDLFVILPRNVSSFLATRLRIGLPSMSLWLFQREAICTNSIIH